MTPFWVSTSDPAEAAQLESLRQESLNGIGRRIPPEEWTRFLPGTPVPLAAYEPADRFAFSPQPLKERYGKPYEAGAHGLWPGRPDYRSVFLLWGSGIRAAKLPEMPMTGIAPRLAGLLTGGRAALPAQK